MAQPTFSGYGARDILGNPMVGANALKYLRFSNFTNTSAETKTVGTAAGDLPSHIVEIHVIKNQTAIYLRIEPNEDGNSADADDGDIPIAAGATSPAAPMVIPVYDATKVSVLAQAADTDNYIVDIICYTVKQV